MSDKIYDGATNTNRMELEKAKASILETVDSICRLQHRFQRNEVLCDEQSRKKLIPEWYQLKYEESLTRELDHIRHVRASYEAIYPDETCWHDCTKDNFYLFVTILAFNLGLKEDLPEGLLQSELDYHLGSEKHHPEYERINHTLVEKNPAWRITSQDIAEMAVDRLSRNLAFNRGVYNDSDIKKFEPKFVYENERRLTNYYDFVRKFKPIVKRVWDSMFRVPISRPKAGMNS